MLMQNIYKVSQGNNEKVPSFAKRLKVNPKPNPAPIPRKIMDLEAQQHLPDCLFHEVRKHICDSIQYVYSTPCMMYLQLMVAAHKAESENEVAQDE